MSSQQESPAAGHRPALPLRARRAGTQALCAAALGLAGCGGGGATPESSSPAIVTQPSSQIAQAGADVTLAIVVQGTGLLYRWQLSIDRGTTWSDIPGATAAQLTIVAPTLAMDGYQYRVVVSSGSGGTSTSTAVTLTVRRPVGEVFRDCSDACPELVVLPRGSFQMGVRPATDVYRDQASPLHTVTIDHDLAVGRSEVTRAEFARFVAATAYRTDAETGGGCWASTPTGTAYRADANWRTPGFVQTDTDPAVCLSWNDAQAFLAWLNSVSPVGGYRLLTEAEWEYAARAASGSTRYPWGDDLAYQQICTHANGADLSARATVPRMAGAAVADCADGHAYTAPADALPANAFGLRHMIGNAWEWVQDGWHASYSGAPVDGSAWAPPAGDPSRIYRGGSWNNHPAYLDPSYRARGAPTFAEEGLGFRVARGL